jgi:hypothetical protein
MPGIFRVDPEDPVVTEVGLEAVLMPAQRPCLSAVKGVEHPHAHYIDLVGIKRINGDPVEAVCSLTAYIILFRIIDPLPLLPSVTGDIDFAPYQIVK